MNQDESVGTEVGLYRYIHLRNVKQGIFACHTCDKVDVKNM